MIFLTPGEKLKKIRDQLGIRQSDLCEANITRNFISMVESNKRRVAYETAENIVNVLNRISEQKGTGLNLDVKSFLTEPEEQAREYCQSLLASDGYDIEEIVQTAAGYKLTDILYNALLEKGDQLYNKTDYLTSFHCYLDALNLTYEINRGFSQPYVYNKIAKCKIALMLYSEALIYLQKAYDSALEHNDKYTLKNSTYNLAYCYLTLDNYEDALDYINKFLEMKELTSSEYISGIILKSNCYLNSNDFKSAESCYTHILEGLNDENFPQLGFIYNNLGIINNQTGNYDTAINYFDKAISIREKIDPRKISHTLIDKANVYISLSDYDTAIEILEKGIEIANSLNDSQYLERGYNKLVQIYEKMNCKDKVEAVYLKLINLMGNKDKSKDLCKIYMKLSLFYLESGKHESSRDLLYKAINELS